MNQVFAKAEEGMRGALEHLKTELGKLRTGRANLGVLDSVRVNYGGVPMPLNQVATLAVPEPRLITIQPWDMQIVSEVEKAIIKANLGLSPSTDGRIIRLPIPAMTEERRLELVKQAKKSGEEIKIKIRACRRDANETLKEMQKKKLLSEDDFKRANERIQKLTDGEIAKVDEILTLKEKEIMKV